MQESTSPPPRYGALSRGVAARDIELAADALLRSGERPTIERVREKIGRGSPNTINPLLDAWWKRLADRLDAGPPALHACLRPSSTLPGPLDASARWSPPAGRARLKREARGAAKLEGNLEIRPTCSPARGRAHARLEHANAISMSFDCSYVPMNLRRGRTRRRLIARPLALCPLKTNSWRGCQAGRNRRAKSITQTETSSGDRKTRRNPPRTTRERGRP